MKLFVWQDVFRDYTPGLAFAIAEDSDQARRLIAKHMGGDFYMDELGKPPEVHELDKPVGFGVYGGG